MSSWIKCPCGNRVHRNLLAGASVRVVITDDELDKVDSSWTAAKTVEHIVAQDEILVQCPICHRIMIEARDTGHVSVYARETDG